VNRQASQPLLIAGALLILLGLVLGAVIPVFTNPRMALSAHQQGIVAGVLLMLFGLAWAHAALASRRARLTERLLIVGAYAIWIGTLLAAAFGTSRATPIAGAGFAGARWQEISVSTVFLLGSLASILGTGLMLSGLVRRATKTEDERER
jgi:hydroxylaminobenzene mutase